MSPRLRIAALLVAASFATSCDNAGAYRTVGITASGIVRGLVYFDANGSGAFDAGDGVVPGARVRLTTLVGGDAVLSVRTDDEGRFRVAGVPVGSYQAVLDADGLADSLTVLRFTGGPFTLRPDDSLSVEGAVGFPSLTVAQARAAAVGTRAFVRGVALHGRGTFSDTLLHAVDTTGALRATRVRPSVAVAGDLVRLGGRIAVRNGQRVLDDVSVFVIGQTVLPTAPLLTTLAASAAGGGSLDGALVRILDASVVDTATVTGSLQVTVNDGSGALTMRLDRVADAAFRAPFAVGPLSAGSRFDLVGVLVPSGGGAWVLRPRDVLDLTRR